MSSLTDTDTALVEEDCKYFSQLVLVFELPTLQNVLANLCHRVPHVVLVGHGIAALFSLGPSHTLHPNIS